MKVKVRRRLRNCKRRIQRRLRKKQWAEQSQRMFQGRNIHYEIGDKAQGLHCGGIGAVHLLVQQLGLADAIDRDLHLLKRHVPYFESDHVLNLTYNLLAGGTCLQDLELLRNNENYLDVLDAQRIPDPTTAGDFLRRFDAADLDTLMRVCNDKRVAIWKQQPESFREEAIIEGDGTLVGTTGECKAGMDLSYDGVWGYHPLLVSLANTQEPLFIVNRSASRPSYEGAAEYLDRAAALCRQAGFRRITFRGDTDFTQTAHLDRWDRAGIRFVFGIDAQPNLVARAEGLPERLWQELPRPARHQVATEPRTRPANVKQEVALKKGYTDIRLVGEQVAELNYRPGACRQDYLVVVLRKHRVLEKKGVKVGEEVRYFFYLTNQWAWEQAAVVYFANDRGNQEKLIEQLKNGVRALRAPSNTLLSNGAYMVIAALAWSLKAWLALVQPRAADRQALLVMGFKRFLQEVVLLPCQVVRAGRRLLYRLLQWNPWVDLLCRSVEVLRRLRFP
ncbi:MAG: IS1380 family transposase [Actinomycetota bacterium]|nr:IS1380 family transposase [Actinomycetota bacterium]